VSFDDILISPPAPKFHLARRAREILDRKCLGASNKQIAAELEITVGSVNAHIRQICHKAGIETWQIVIFGLQQPAARRQHGLCSAGLHPLLCPCDFCARTG